MDMVDSALETLSDDLCSTCIRKILVALVKDSGGQKVTPILKLLMCIKWELPGEICVITSRQIGLKMRRIVKIGK